ncbi:MAG TPA: DUF885 family protein, partial [Longimicrobium sp.]|nr:DUF885 family protein [Longimicrobium sp.]
MHRLFVVLTTLALAAPLGAQDTAEARLKRFFDEQWERTLQENPLLATSFGDRRYNARLSEEGLAAQRRSVEANRAALVRLRGIPRDSLSARDRRNYDIFLRSASEAIEDAGFDAHLIPITNREGFHTFFPELPSRVPLATVRDYQDYIARLRGFRAYAGQHIELMREGIRV